MNASVPFGAALAFAITGLGMSGPGEHMGATAAKLPVEGKVPSFAKATGWLNSPPLTPNSLRGHVVVIDVWTYTCINWLRTLPYVRAWAEKYKDRGLVVVGVHTPEFPFEKDVENVRRAAREMRVTYPIALDGDYGVWRALDNHYWPALYVADAEGRIRYHHFGEGAYERSEMVIQQLLAEAGQGASQGLVAVDPEGLEVAADLGNLKSPESYVRSDGTGTFASPGGAVPEKRHAYTFPASLGLNQWALSGRWTIGKEAVVLGSPGGRVGYRFHARDVNLVMGPAARGSSVRFRVLLDGHPPGPAHGGDVDADGLGALKDQRLHQLIRQAGPITDRLFEIEFLEPGAEAYCFTFG